MILSDELDNLETVFLDTAPIIYYIEAHPQFGPLVKEIVNCFQSGKLKAYSSVVTIAEVLPKPVENGNVKLAEKFSGFLRSGKNITLMDISADIAESAGKLRGQYPPVRTLDALQIAASIKARADAFITNDLKLKQVEEVQTIVLKDYL
jgi:predicted nucleic acid-binding protein